MKRFLQIMILMLLFAGCADEEKRLDGNYVVKYRLLNYENGDNHINTWDRRILNFQDDTLKIKHFPLQIFFDSNYVDSHAYELLQDILLVFKDEAIDTFSFDISNDTMSLTYLIDQKIHEEISTTTVLEKIPSYNLGHKDSLFHEYLLNRSFVNGDSLGVDFNADASIFYSKLNLGSYSHNWMVDKYNEELFLNLDGGFGIIIHIIEFDKYGFKGTYYGKKHREMVFKKQTAPPKYDLKSLNGNWVDSNEETEPFPKLWEDEYEDEFFAREELNITDTTITKSFGYGTKDYKWISNIDQDFLHLYLSNRKGRIYKNNWQIEFLSNDQLTIIRYRDGSFFPAAPETMNYKRIIN